MAKNKVISKSELIEMYISNIQGSLISAFEGYAYRRIHDLTSKCKYYADDSNKLIDIEIDFVCELLEHISEVIDTYSKTMLDVDDVTPSDYKDFVDDLFDSYSLMCEIAHDVIFGGIK